MTIQIVAQKKWIFIVSHSMSSSVENQNCITFSICLSTFFLGLKSIFVAIEVGTPKTWAEKHNIQAYHMLENSSIEKIEQD